MSASSDYAIVTEGLARTYRVPKPKTRAKTQPTVSTGSGAGAGAGDSNGSGGGRHGANGRSTEFIALKGVDLTVGHGEIFGLLGPNGAGKSTLIKILSTLLLPSAGRAWVGGFDVEHEPHRIKPIINMVSGGETSGFGMLTVREQLWMFSQFYGLTNRQAFAIIDPMLETLGLSEAAQTRVSKLSTGMRQKMNFIRGFLNSPEILFLDEPTLGLDVSAARAIRTHIQGWLARYPRKTVLLTTHYMAEADELCDRVAIIDKGGIVACDSPSALKSRIGQDVVLGLELTGAEPKEGAFAGALSGLPGVRRTAFSQETARGVTQATVILEDDRPIPAVIACLAEAGAHVTGVHKSEVTLEDVFLELVGRKLRDEGGEKA